MPSEQLQCAHLFSQPLGDEVPDVPGKYTKVPRHRCLLRHRENSDLCCSIGCRGTLPPSNGPSAVKEALKAWQTHSTLSWTYGSPLPVLRAQQPHWQRAKTHIWGEGGEIHEPRAETMCWDAWETPITTCRIWGNITTSESTGNRHIRGMTNSLAGPRWAVPWIYLFAGACLCPQPAQEKEGSCFLFQHHTWTRRPQSGSSERTLREQG